MIEAGWLAVLVAAPLYYNANTLWSFEPDKAVLVRSLSLVMALAWVVKLGCGGRPWLPAGKAESAGPWWQAFPLLPPAVALGLVSVLACLLSLSPRLSWWGSALRQQGTATALAYLVLFLLTAGHLRSREQWRRLVLVVVLGGVVLSCHALLQRLGLDPQVARIAELQSRPGAALGNAVSLAATLLLPILVTVHHLFGRLLRLLQAATRRPGDWWCSLGWLAALLVQLAAFLATGSRGPTLGLLAGLHLLVLLELLRLRGRAWMLPVASGIALCLLGLLLAVLRPAVEPGSLLGRQAAAFDLGSDAAVGRLAIWSKGIEIAVNQPPLRRTTDGGVDQLDRLRLLVGHGPETIHLLFQQHYPARLGQVVSPTAIPRSSHNLLLDALLTTGLLGLCATLWILVVVSTCGLEWLGLIESRSQRRRFLVMLVLLAVLGIGLPRMTGEPALGCLGMPAGMVAAMLVWVVAAAGSGWRALSETEPWRYRVVAVGLAWMIAHLVEIQLGPTVTATSSTFWIMLAVLGVVGKGWLVGSDSVEDRCEAARDACRGRRPVVVRALLVGLVLMVLMLGLLSNRGARPSTWPVLVADLLETRPVAGVQVPVLGFLVLATWLAGALLLGCGGRGEARGGWRRLLLLLGVSAVVVLPAAVLVSGRLAAVARLESSGQVLAGAGHLASLPVLRLAVIVVLMVALALLLPWLLPPSAESARYSRRAGPVAVPLALVIGVAAVIGTRANLQVGAGDTYLRCALQARAEDRDVLFARARLARPEEDSYPARWAEMTLARASRSQGLQQRRLLSAALQRAELAQRLDPYELSHLVRIAHLRQARALSSGPKERQEELQRALTEIERAVELAPSTAILHNLRGQMLQQLGRRQEALAALQQSLAVDPQLAETYQLLGDLLMVEARVASRSGLDEEARRLEELAKKAHKTAQRR